MNAQTCVVIRTFGKNHKLISSSLGCAVTYWKKNAREGTKLVGEERLTFSIGCTVIFVFYKKLF